MIACTIAIPTKNLIDKVKELRGVGRLQRTSQVAKTGKRGKKTHITDTHIKTALPLPLLPHH
jgi:hypothetical protein